MEKKRKKKAAASKAAAAKGKKGTKSFGRQSTKVVAASPAKPAATATPVKTTPVAKATPTAEKERAATIQPGSNPVLAPAIEK